MSRRGDARASGARWLTVAEAARRARVSLRQAYRLARREWGAVVLGRRLLVPADRVRPPPPR